MRTQRVVCKYEGRGGAGCLKGSERERERKEGREGNRERRLMPPLSRSPCRDDEEALRPGEETPTTEHQPARHQSGVCQTIKRIGVCQTIKGFCRHCLTFAITFAISRTS